VHSGSLKRTSIVSVFLVVCCHASGTSAASLSTSSADLAVSRCIKTIRSSHGASNEKNKVELDFYCPDLVARINRLPLAKNLNYRFDSTSSIAELKDLRQFLAMSSHTQAHPFLFDFSKVQNIVNTVSPPAPEAKPDLWSRFWTWVKHFFPNRDKKQDDKLGNLFQKFKLSKNARDVITYVSSALIVILAFWVVFREWFYFRRVGSAVRSKRSSVSLHGAPQITGPIRLGDVDKLPALYQVPALLHWSIDYCIDRGELPSDQSLTSREMLRILNCKNSRYAGYFGDVVKESEKVVYGNQAPDHSVLGKLISSARSFEDPVKGGAT